MKPDQSSRTESAARDAANLAGRVEDFGGGVGHEFTYQPGPGRLGTVVVCSCGWKSPPTRLVFVDSVKRGHLAEVATDA